MNLSRQHFLSVYIVFLQLSPFVGLCQSVDTTHYRLKNQVYKTTPQDTLTMDIYYPKNYEGNQLPAVVFFFGGGWTGGNRDHFSHHSKYLASRGMIAITPDYRIFKKHGTPPQKAVADARSAMRYVKQHAQELGVDTSRLAAGGGSAGGHLALGTATLNGFDDPDDDLSLSPRPQALVLYNPVVNTTSEGFGATRVGEDSLHLSPYHQATSDMPPVLIFHGEDDTTVPIANIKTLEAKLDALKVPNQVFTYAGQSHGFFNLGREEGKYFWLTLKETNDFFQSLGYLPPASKP